MKIIGSLLILFASIVASYLYESSLKRSIEILCELVELIKTTRHKIEYYSLPVEDILKEYDCKNTHLKQMINGDFFTGIHIDVNIQKDIENYFSMLGRGYKKEQLSLCDYTINSLENALNNMKTEFIKKAKVFRSLSLFLGVGVVILLV